MNRIVLKGGHILVLLLTGLLLSESALADRPHSRAGGDGGERHAHNERHARDDYHRHDHRRYDNDINVSIYFGDQHRTVIRDYYEERYHTGHCPPGLARKHNGCMPPGQIKRWRRGYPLPRDVIFYDLPPSVVIQLGPPPPRHRYVRVAADILLIAIGTGIVVDAIEDLDNR